MTHSLTSECTQGIDKTNFGATNHEILSEAKVSGNFRDLIFDGTFCPLFSGKYRLIFEAPIDNTYDKISTYKFNGIPCERTSPYHYLHNKTCYPYNFAQAISSSTYGYLYYQKDNEEKQIITSSTSYSCKKKVCLRGSKDPECFRFHTCVKNNRNSYHSNIPRISLFFIISLK